MPPDPVTALARKWCPECKRKEIFGLSVAQVHLHVHHEIATAIREALEEAEKRLCIGCRKGLKRVKGCWVANATDGQLLCHHDERENSENIAHSVCQATAIVALREGRDA